MEIFKILAPLHMWACQRLKGYPFWKYNSWSLILKWYSHSLLNLLNALLNIEIAQLQDILGQEGLQYPHE